MSDVEQFGERLKTAIGEALERNCNGYVHHSELMTAIHKALHPPGQPDVEFPRMLFKGTQQRTVNSLEESVHVEAEGWRRDPPQPPAGYPKCLVETDRSRGTDYRRVILMNAAEETQFRAATEPEHWKEDPEYQFGGRPVSLDELVSERKQLLQRIIAAEPLQEVESESDAVGREKESALKEPPAGGRLQMPDKPLLPPTPDEPPAQAETLRPKPRGRWPWTLPREAGE